MVKTEKKSLKVGKYLNSVDAHTLLRNYKKERWVQNSKRLGKADSISCWFSTEELKEFLETCVAHGADGVRLHFGVYPSEFPERPAYAGRQTVVLMATKTRQRVEGEVEKYIHIQRDGQLQILAYNRGILCPPSCPMESPSIIQ